MVVVVAAVASGFVVSSPPAAGVASVAAAAGSVVVGDDLDPSAGPEAAGAAVALWPARTGVGMAAAAPAVKTATE